MAQAQVKNAEEPVQLNEAVAGEVTRFRGVDALPSFWGSGGTLIQVPLVLESVANSSEKYVQQLIDALHISVESYF